MKKIKMLNRISLDGCFASLNEGSHGMEWFIHDPEVDKAAHEIGGKMNTLILGGTTYRNFEQFWVPVLKDAQSPKEMKAVAEELTAMTKIVFSRKMNTSDWSNTRINNANLIEVVRQLKQDSSSDILLLGSGSIVQQLAAEGLVDEYIFIVTPVVVGEGKHLFAENKQVGLNLVQSIAFDSGNVILHYELKK